MQPEPQAQEGRLARAVWTEQAEHAARLDGQRYIVERDLPVLVDLRERLRLDDKLGVLRHGPALRRDSLGRYSRGGLPNPPLFPRSMWSFWTAFALKLDETALKRA